MHTYTRPPSYPTFSFRDLSIFLRPQSLLPHRLYPVFWYNLHNLMLLAADDEDDDDDRQRWRTTSIWDCPLAGNNDSNEEHKINFPPAEPNCAWILGPEIAWPQQVEAEMSFRLMRSVEQKKNGGS